jgi:GTP cyclohydrolase I
LRAERAAASQVAPRFYAARIERAVLEAEHLCLRLRGARSPAAAMKTVTHRGLFAEDAGRRQEVLAALQR